MLHVSGMHAANRQFSKRRILQHLTEAGKTLLQDFFPVGKEKQLGPLGTGLQESPVIKG